MEISNANANRPANAGTGRRLSAAGSRFAIATPHDAATRAGVAAFEAGGNALDAALAAASTLAVTYPMMCGVGGDLFALVKAPDGSVVSVNSSGRSPAGLDADAVRSSNDTMPARGPFAITVPGAVAGWASIHALGARLPWRAAFDHAVRHAKGVPVAPGVAASIREDAPMLALDPGAAAVFLPQGGPLDAGATLANEALARTLAALAEDGPAALYGGEVGALYARGLRALGCPIALEDLAEHRADLLEPLAARFGDLEVRTAPPTSQGFSMLQALMVIDELGLDPDPLGPDAGRLALAFVAAGRERDGHLADPRAMRVSVPQLLSERHVHHIASAVRSGALPDPTGTPALGGTVGLVAADADGFAVSLIQSLSWGFGSGVLEPSTGILAQNRGSGFVLDRSHPNDLAPGKLPAHTLMPVMAHRDGRLVGVSGTMGGPAHPQINAMSLLRAHVLGFGAAEAVAAPRWIAGGMDAVEGIAHAEADVPDTVAAALEQVGLRVGRLGRHDSSTGHAHLIVLDEEGAFDVGTDPRADGEAASA
jgi:gamma-glutamyltranspeptidase